MLRLIEPDHLAGLGMLARRRTNAARPQPVAVFPFAGHSRSAARSLDLGFTRRPKNILPVQPQTVAVVAYVHELLFHELFAEGGIEHFKHFAAIGHRRLAALRRGLGA